MKNCVCARVMRKLVVHNIAEFPIALAQDMIKPPMEVIFKDGYKCKKTIMTVEIEQHLKGPSFSAIRRVVMGLEEDESERKD